MSEKATERVTGAEMGKIVCAHYGLDPFLVPEASLLMMPEGPARAVITMFAEPEIDIKLPPAELTAACAAKWDLDSALLEESPVIVDNTEYPRLIITLALERKLLGKLHTELNPES